MNRPPFATEFRAEDRRLFRVLPWIALIIVAAAVAARWLGIGHA